MLKEKLGLTIENIFEKPKYRIIFHLLMWNYHVYRNYIPHAIKEHKLKFCHFRYALMKEHGLSTDSVKRIKRFFKIELPSVIANQKVTLESELKNIRKHDMIDSSDMFNSIQALHNILNRARKLGLINIIQEKKGYNSYEISQKGRIGYHRSNIKMKLESFPNELLEELEKFMDTKNPIADKFVYVDSPHLYYKTPESWKNHLL